MIRTFGGMTPHHSPHTKLARRQNLSLCFLNLLTCQTNCKHSAQREIGCIFGRSWIRHFRSIFDWKMMYVDYTYAATTGADGSFRAARYEYDSSGLLSRVSSESSVANRTVHTDTALNQIATITDVNNQSSTFEYGNRGHFMKTSSLNGAASTYTRNASGRITQQTTLNGVSRYEYYLAGRLLKSTQANGDTYVNTFDAGARLSESADLRGNTIQISYDVFNRISAIEVRGVSGSFFKRMLRVGRDSYKFRRKLINPLISQDN